MHSWCNIKPDYALVKIRVNVHGKLHSPHEGPFHVIVVLYWSLSSKDWELCCILNMFLHVCNNIRCQLVPWRRRCTLWACLCRAEMSGEGYTRDQSIIWSLDTHGLTHRVGTSHHMTTICFIDIYSNRSGVYIRIFTDLAKPVADDANKPSYFPLPNWFFQK